MPIGRVINKLRGAVLSSLVRTRLLAQAPADSCAVAGKLLNSHSCGEVCERLKQSVLKTDIPERVSGVRIPPSPPCTIILLKLEVSLSIESKGRSPQSPTGD